MEWIELGQGGDRWWAVVHAVMDLRVSENEGYFLTTCETFSSELGRCYMVKLRKYASK